MPLSEFELIKQFFTHTGSQRDDVAIGIGDDCALLQVPQGELLAVTMDTLVDGVHFLPGTNPEALGHKALAVNLSDLAAMGATPAWVTLTLTLPSSDADWLAAFSRGFADLASRYQIQLVGGDTSRGPLAVTVQAHGLIEPGKALRRDAARPGDRIYVTGVLGDAGLALLALQQGNDCTLRDRLERPTPRLEVGKRLTGIAHACIDISDGLIADLGHICTASGVGAELSLELIPLSPQVRDHVATSGDWEIPLAAGDDYELCLTVPPQREAQLHDAVNDLETPLTLIGSIEQEQGIVCRQADGTVLEPLPGCYEHFIALNRR